MQWAANIFSFWLKTRLQCILFLFFVHVAISMYIVSKSSELMPLLRANSDLGWLNARSREHYYFFNYYFHIQWNFLSTRMNWGFAGFNSKCHVSLWKSGIDVERLKSGKFVIAHTDIAALTRSEHADISCLWFQYHWYLTCHLLEYTWAEMYVQKNKHSLALSSLQTASLSKW